MARRLARLNRRQKLKQQPRAHLPLRRLAASEALEILGQPQPEAQPVTKPADVAPPEAKAEASAATGAEVEPAPAKETVSAPKQTASAKDVAADEPKDSVRDNALRAARDNGSGSGAEATAEELRRTKSSPLVRKIAEEHGVDIAGLEGTGLSGRVTKNDILSFIESGSTAGAAGTKAQTAGRRQGRRTSRDSRAGSAGAGETRRGRSRRADDRDAQEDR